MCGTKIRRDAIEPGAADTKFCLARMPLLDDCTIFRAGVSTCVWPCVSCHVSGYRGWVAIRRSVVASPGLNCLAQLSPFPLIIKHASFTLSPAKRNKKRSYQGYLDECFSPPSKNGVNTPRIALVCSFVLRCCATVVAGDTRTFQLQGPRRHMGMSRLPFSNSSAFLEFKHRSVGTHLIARTRTRTLSITRGQTGPKSVRSAATAPTYNQPGAWVCRFGRVDQGRAAPRRRRRRRTDRRNPQTDRAAELHVAINTTTVSPKEAKESPCRNHTSANAKTTPAWRSCLPRCRRSAA